MSMNTMGVTSIARRTPMDMPKRYEERLSARCQGLQEFCIVELQGRVRGHHKGHERNDIDAYVFTRAGCTPRRKCATQ